MVDEREVLSEEVCVLVANMNAAIKKMIQLGSQDFERELRDLLRLKETIDGFKADVQARAEESWAKEDAQ